VSGDFCFDAGAEAHAVVSSVVDAARKCGESIFDTWEPIPDGKVYHKQHVEYA